MFDTSEIYLEKGLGTSEEDVNELQNFKNVALCWKVCFKC